MQLPRLLPIVLVAGGLYDEPPMTGERFWLESGVAGALSGRGVEFAIHERPTSPRSWAEEAEAIAATMDRHGWERAGIVAGSNGCSAALRLLVDDSERVARLMLCWPATAADPVIDELARVIITDAHDPGVARDLLQGDPIRGVSRSELATVDRECAVYPSLPENKVHQRSTVVDLVESIPDAILVGGSPEPTDDAFDDFLDSFAAVVAAFAQIEHDD